MPIEDRTGVCRICQGPAYRHPSRANNIPDRWVHRSTADWIDNPHEVDPVPSTPSEEETTP